jgi:membrane fusion protein (multidrug efflux system)
MPPPFEQTLRALDTDRVRGMRIAVAFTLVLAAGWIAWMCIGDVPVYRTSLRARLEVLPAPTHVASLVGGIVVASGLQVGDRVARGDVLLELDAQAERIALDRARAQLAALEPELAALDRELASEGGAVLAGEAAGRSTVREQLAHQRQADSDLAHAEEVLARERAMFERGVSAQADFEKARAEVATKRAAREALSHATEAMTASERARDAGRRSRVAELEGQRAEVSGKIAVARTEIARLELDVDRHIVRAPVAGVLGAVATRQPGAVMAAGDSIATIVPEGTLQVVADYGPTAIGRLASGQPARIRLDGFPWTRWGTMPLRVRAVANEVRDGSIRVELAIEAGPHRIPLAHGMTGLVEVEVEHASPAALVLRSVVDRSADER